MSENVLFPQLVTCALSSECDLQATREILLYPFAKKTLTGHTHLCPERAQDELASARGAHGGEEVGVLPRVDSGSVDRRAFLEQVRELGGGRLASAGRNVDRGMHDRQPEGLRQLHRRHDVLQHHVRSMDWTAAICEGW